MSVTINVIENAPDEITITVQEAVTAAPIVPKSVTGGESITLTAGSLIKDFLIIAASDTSLLIGTTEGGEELLNITLSNGDVEFIGLAHYAATEETIYITGDASVKFKLENYA